MVKKQVIFRTITEQSKGYGNLNRSITVAGALRKIGYDVIFLIDNNANASSELRKRNFYFKIVPKFKSKNTELEYLRALFVRSNWNEAVILDMREFSEKMSKYFKQQNFKTILLDDAWCKNAYSDIIINGTITKNYHNYKKINSNAQVFTGQKYWIINENFLQNKKPLSHIHSKKKYNVTISLGGADPKFLTFQVISALIDINKITITVIVGPFFNSKFLKKLSKIPNIKVIYSSPKIWNEFYKSDLAISAAGNTLYELCIQGIPTICIPIVKHQIPYAKYFHKKGICMNLGYANTIDKKLLYRTILDLLSDHKKRKQMTMTSKKIFDGKGLARVTMIIDRFLKLK